MRDARVARDELVASLDAIEAEPEKYKVHHGEVQRRKNLMNKMQHAIQAGEEELTGRKQDLFGADRQSFGLRESAYTRGRSSQQLYDDHESKLQQQDESIDSILAGVGRLRQMGHDINDELSLHDALLQDVDHDMDRVGDRVVDNTRLTEKLIRKDSTTCGFMLILVLLVAIIIVAVV